MLTRLIVDLYAWIIEIALWGLLVGAAIFGFLHGLPMASSIGSSGADPMLWKVFSALALPLIVFLLLIVVVGPFLFLVDIRKSIRALEASTIGSAGGMTAPSLEHKEPYLREK